MTAASVAETPSPEVREKPILFSAPMVRAILAGTKTQTRRLVKLPLAPNHLGCWEETTVGGEGEFLSDGSPAPLDVAIWHTRTGACVASRVRVGDRLWVREAWRAWERDEDGLDHIWHRADGSKIPIPNTRAAGDFVVGKFDRWRPGIHMPRWASRITLEVAEVRVQRLGDISEEDAEAEGVEAMDGHLDEPALYRRAKEMGGTATDARVWYAALWDLINAKRAPWSANPWVWAVSFRVVPQ